MTVVNGYCSIAQLKSATKLAAGDLDLDDLFELAINAASRQIDDYCGQRFWQDGSVIVRELDAEDSWCCPVPDNISTTTGLIVKTDTGLDGTYATTLTLNTHFVLLPRNADKEYPIRPWNEVRVLTTSNAYLPVNTYGRGGVQVTAKFGWPAIPDNVTKACVEQAKRLYRSPSLGIVELETDGMRVPPLNSIAKGLLAGLQRVYV